MSSSIGCARSTIHAIRARDDRRESPLPRRAPVIRRILAGLVLAAAIAVAVLLPPRSMSVTPSPGPRPLFGAVHVHTTNSDGSGTPDEVAAAASRAGLSFLILTDHGDAMRAPDNPRYRSGVLVIDAVEVSTSGGHIVALGLPRAPYPLRGEPADVLEDLTRLGAMTIVAHPTSMKQDLRWHDPGRPFDGIEWLNGDSEWRDERPLSLARILLTYWFRAPESLALILDRPAAALALWDRASQRHEVVGLGGSDAHAKIGGDMDHGGPAAVHLPSYEQVFRTFSIGLPGVRLSRDAAADTRVVLEAIRAGHLFTAIDAFAAPARLSLTATGDGVHAAAGDRVLAGPALALRAEVDAPALAPTLTLYRNGAVATTTVGSALEYRTDGTAGVYRVEATLPVRRGGGPLAPWLVSNPIYVGPRQPDMPAVPLSPTASRRLYTDGPSPLVVEQSPRSVGAVGVVAAVGGRQLYLRYALGGARTDAPFVAFATPALEIAGFTAVSFSAHASHPMRVSIQLRAAAEQGSGRWRRSVYLDETQRQVTLPFAEFLPVRSGLAATPPLADITGLLVVVDSTNTALGSNGEIWLDDLAFVR
jgi:hypothetical protein